MKGKTLTVALGALSALALSGWLGWTHYEKQERMREFQVAVTTPRLKSTSRADHIAAIWEAATKVGEPESKREAAKIGLDEAYQAAISESPAVAEELLQTVSNRIAQDASLSGDQQAKAIKEQADYQAAVAAQMHGDKAKAKTLLTGFIEEYPDTPFINSVYRRLHDLAGSEEERQAIDVERQNRYDAQQERLMLRIAECGPRALHRWLIERGGNPPVLETLIQECQLTREGATMEDLQRVAGSHGLRLEGYALNRPDFLTRRTPFIWLQSAHYVLVLGRTSSTIKIFDPMTGQDRELPLGEPSGKPESYFILGSSH